MEAEDPTSAPFRSIPNNELHNIKLSSAMGHLHTKTHIKCPKNEKQGDSGEEGSDEGTKVEERQLVEVVRICVGVANIQRPGTTANLSLLSGSWPAPRQRFLIGARMWNRAAFTYLLISLEPRLHPPTPASPSRFSTS